MSGSDVEMQDASAVVRCYDIYEVPIRMGPTLQIPDKEYSWDQFGNRIKDGDIWTEGTKTSREETTKPSSEHLPKDKGKAVESEILIYSPPGRENTEFDVLICDKGDSAIIGRRTNMPDEEWCRIAEDWAFDDFEKAVKSIFFKTDRLARGRELLHQGFEEALNLARDGNVEVVQALISVIFEMNPTQALDFFEVMTDKIEGMVGSPAEPKTGQEESATHQKKSERDQEASSETAKEPGTSQEESKSTDLDENLVVPIIIGMAHTLQVFHGEELDQLLAVAWNGLITRCLRLVEKTPVKGPCVHRTLHKTFQVILEKGSRVEDVLCNVRHDRELLRFITNSWCNDLPFDEEDAYSTAILLRIGKDSGAMGRLVNLILRAHKGFEDTTAEHIIRRIDVASDLSVHLSPLRRSLKGEVDDPLVYRRLFFEIKWMLHLLTSKRNPKEGGETRQSQLAANPLFVRIVVDDFFGEITRVIRGKFVDRFPGPGSPFRAVAFECSHALNTFYADSFQHDLFGSLILERALEQGYMSHLMKLSARVLPEDSNSALCKTLEKIVGLIIPCFLIRPDIVEVAVLDYRKVHQQEVWDRIMASPLAEAWKKLKAVLLEREAHRHLYGELKKENKHVASNICSFCLTPKENIKPLRCAGCKAVYYCSKACQVQAWQSEHKAECKKLEAGRSVLLNTMQFQEFCVRRDIARHRPGLEKKVKSVFETDNASLSSMLAEIDYSCVPMRIVLKPIEKSSKPIPKGVLVCKCRCFPGVEIKPFFVYLPLSLLKGGEQPPPDDLGDDSKTVHRLCAQDEEGKLLETVAWDVFDQHILKNRGNFAPWLREPYPQVEPREKKVQLFEPPLIPEEYEDDAEFGSESESESEEGTVKASDNATEVLDGGSPKMGRRPQRDKIQPAQ